MKEVLFNNKRYEITNSNNQVKIDKFNNLVQVYDISACRVATSFDAFIEVLASANKNCFTKKFLNSLNDVVNKLLIESDKRSKEEKYEFLNVCKDIIKEKQHQNIKEGTVLAAAVAQGAEVPLEREVLFGGRIQ